MNELKEKVAMYKTLICVNNNCVRLYIKQLTFRHC